GLNGSQVHGDQASGFDKAGLVVGAFVCNDPSQKWYGQMELQYTQKGSRKLANPEMGDYTSFKISLHYVEAAFLARRNISKFYFEFGETVGILGFAREWDVNGEIQPTGYRRWETAFIVGIGMGFTENIYLDFRYTNSLFPVKPFPSPIYDPRFFFRWFNRGFYNNVLGITLCYRFGVPASE
ncbi:MAG TPA: outer membrane beta-barrel protein, partial [Bacteroidia bacterium]|nr:outer membrane beta-barrel protein [Bacteroidia bacterium]